MLTPHNLEKFYLADQDQAVELDFITAAKLFEATPETRREKIFANYHELLEMNKAKLIENLTDEEFEETTSRRGRDNAVRVAKILKSKEMRSYKGFTDIDDEYIKRVIKLLDDGVLPRSVTKRLFTALKDITEPLKILSAIKRNLPDEYFQTNAISHDHIMAHPNEVILTECFIK